MSTERKQLLAQTDTALREIAKGGEETLRAIYKEYRSEFLSWAKQTYRIPENDAIDIFQDAVIIFYKNVIKGKITKLESSIKTYLFGICKKKVFKYYSAKGKLELVEDMNDPLLRSIDWKTGLDMELNPRIELILEALDQLKERCMKIIDFFYFRRFSMEAIKENMNYNSEEVARSSKRSCMKELEAIVKKKLGKN